MSASLDALDKRCQVQRPDVFRKVERARMIGRVGGYGFWVVIDASDNLGTLLTIQPCLVDSSGGSSGAAE